MKVLLLVAVLSILCSLAQGFDKDEFIEILCSAPNHYAKRYLRCVVSDGPSSVTKVFEVLHSCVSLYYSVENVVDSLHKNMCKEELPSNPNITRCLRGKENELQEPTEEEMKQMKEVLINCLGKA